MGFIQDVKQHDQRILAGEKPYTTICGGVADRAYSYGMMCADEPSVVVTTACLL